MTKTEITYTGSPAFVSAFAQALTDEGLEVDYVRPQEQRDGGTAAAVTVVTLWVIDKVAGTALEKVTDEAIERALARWKAGRLARAAQIKVGPRHRS